jgi:23S rRNA pseudouridine1911/1915/1917 synthase
MKTFTVVQTTSTMDLARTLIAERGSATPFAVMCRVQTAGRGRGGSVWTQAGASEAGAGQENSQVVERADVAGGVQQLGDFGPCTFVIPAQFVKIPLSWLSLAVGCAVVDALWRARARLANMLEFSRCMPAESPCEARLKWPNDVWAWPQGRLSHAPKKVAGILCESSFRADSLQFVSIGLGLNLFSAPEQVAQASSVLSLWGVNPSAVTAGMRKTMSMVVAEEIERELADYLQIERSSEQLMHLTLERSLPLGTPLSVNKGAQTGAFAGLSAEGGLLLEGHRDAILSADVSFPQISARVCVDFGNTQIHWRSECSGAVRAGQINWAQLDKRTVAEQNLFNKSELAQSLLAAVEGAQHVQLVWSAVANAGHSAKVVDCIESLFIHHGNAAREVSLSPVNADAVMRDAGLDAEYVAGHIGVDRALQAWAAAQHARQLAKPVAVFSVGTALTAVVVSPELKILDSIILAGPAMSLRALHEKTARLPNVTLPSTLPSPQAERDGPFSTPLSMLRGISLQLAGLVESLVRRYSVGQVLLTGGGAAACFEVLDEPLQRITRVDAQLVLAAMSRFIAEQKNARYTPTAGDEEGEDGLPEKVLQSMLRARISRRREQRVVPDKKHFRRLGGRLEHVGVGLRLDRHLGEKFKFHTRDIWQQRVEIGEVLIEQNSPKNHTSDAAPANLLNVKPTYVLKQGDQLWLFHPPEYEPDMMTDIAVVYDDGDAAVFCKPGNLVVHAAGLYGKNTFIEIAKKMGYANAAPVHRIDRETSGILVCARSTPLRRDLSLSFRDSSVKKMYLAVTKGDRPLPDAFRVSLPIGPAINSRIRLKLWHNPNEGLDALTHCLRLAQWEDYSLFACMPQTGRTNQIRVHLAAVGHWIVGDKMYHPDEDAFLQFYEEGYIQTVAEKVLLPRHWLHNTGIQFLSRPDCGLGNAPVIAPLTDDLMGHGPTIELLRRAQLPLTADEQKIAFSELFKKILQMDYSAAPHITPSGSD